MMKLVLKVLYLVFAFVAFNANAGCVTIGSQVLKLTACDYAAYAFCSITFKGVQLLDSNDHGRCMQPAVSFNGEGEANNPTLAGSQADGGIYNPSSSRVLDGIASTTSAALQVQMANWNQVRGAVLSDVMLREYVRVEGEDQIYMVVEFGLPVYPVYWLATYEILTGYMPVTFSKFRTYDGWILSDLNDGPGEQARPIIFCTQNDEVCIGVISDNTTNGGYGRWRSPQGSNTVKWNVVSRVYNPQGTNRTCLYLVIGNLQRVVAAMKAKLNPNP